VVECHWLRSQLLVPLCPEAPLTLPELVASAQALHATQRAAIAAAGDRVRALALAASAEVGWGGGGVEMP
jgi:hypothetical protein